MKQSTTSNIKLGAFVIAGLSFLIVLLYMLGKNQNLFGSSFELKAHFTNAQGLTQGNNVRYLGIQVGTVRRVRILNDTLIEVTMLIKTSVKKSIYKDAIVSIGTDGLVGNKIINITPGINAGTPVDEGDVLAVRKTVDTDDMLQALAGTSTDVQAIAAELRRAVSRLKNSSTIWSLLEDSTVPINFRATVLNIRNASVRADKTVAMLEEIVGDIKNGKGTVGAIIKDTTLVGNLNAAIAKVRNTGDEAEHLAQEMQKLIQEIRYEGQYGKGPLNAVLKDSTMVLHVRESLDNLEKGTKGINEVIDGLKHNFLLRGYFRKLEKQNKKRPDSN